MVTSSFFIYIQLHGKQCKEGFRIDGGRIYLNSIYFNLKTWNLLGFRVSLLREGIYIVYIHHTREKVGIGWLRVHFWNKVLISLSWKKIFFSAFPIQSRNILIYYFSYFKPRNILIYSFSYFNPRNILIYFFSYFNPRNILIYFLF